MSSQELNQEMIQEQNENNDLSNHPDHAEHKRAALVMALKGVIESFEGHNKLAGHDENASAAAAEALIQVVEKNRELFRSLLSVVEANIQGVYARRKWLTILSMVTLTNNHNPFLEFVEELDYPLEIDQDASSQDNGKFIIAMQEDGFAFETNNITYSYYAEKGAIPPEAVGKIDSLIALMTWIGKVVGERMQADRNKLFLMAADNLLKAGTFTMTEDTTPPSGELVGAIGAAFQNEVNAIVEKEFVGANARAAAELSANKTKH